MTKQGRGAGFAPLWRKHAMTYFERFTPDPCPTDYMRYFWNGWEIVEYDDGCELNDKDGDCVATSLDPEWLAHCAVLGGMFPKEAQS
jgi:hypothetical protein